MQMQFALPYSLAQNYFDDAKTFTEMAICQTVNATELVHIYKYALDSHASLEIWVSSVAFTVQELEPFP